jgi:hypothetical protein
MSTHLFRVATPQHLQIVQVQESPQSAFFQKSMRQMSVCEMLTPYINLELSLRKIVK